MKAFIFTGGSITPQNISEKREKDDIVIAADSGYLNALKLDFIPDVLVGDFDSLDKSKVGKDVEIVELPTEKDLTDTQVACQIAIESGATQIFLIGGLDGRLDHTFSNVAILRMLCAKGIYSYITDGENRVRYIKNTNTIIVRSPYKYLSVLADDEVVKGVDIYVSAYAEDGVDG